MLDIIKSSYFIKYLFSYLDEKRKLDLVRHNKSFQDNLNINLIDYKMVSDRNIIIDKNGKIKEFNNKGKLLFEGEYLNGKRNGKGKEFGFEGKVCFEGEYLNGKRNGKGKEFYLTGKKLYEGEYLKGKRNGKGKEFDLEGNLQFEGEYLNGVEWNAKAYNKQNQIIYELKNGNGFIKKIFSSYGYLLQFEGEYLNGKKNGKGKEHLIGGNLVFEGEFLNGDRWNGKFYYPYNGEIKDGKGLLKIDNFYGNLPLEVEYFNGKSIKLKVFSFRGKVIYEEKNYIDKRNVKKYDFDGNLIFEGEYLNNNQNGRGKEYNSKNELIFEGEFLNDYRRKGREYLKGRLEFEGEYLFNIKWSGKGYNEKGNIIYELKNGNGKYKEYNINGDLIFDGEYLNGIKWNGKGYGSDKKIILELKQGKGFIKEKYSDLYFHEGEYSDGKINGKGKKEYKNGRFEGEFKNSECEGYGLFYYKDGDKYEGEFKKEFPNGYGIYYYSNGDIYEGEFKNRFPNGLGIFYFSNGDIYEGEFKDGLAEGNGIFYFRNGGRYEGIFKNNIYDGYGTFYSSLGFKYEGYFKDNLSTKLLIFGYRILLFIKQKISIIIRNKTTLFLIIILILGILVNY